jgi:hypothetical protein
MMETHARLRHFQSGAFSQGEHSLVARFPLSPRKAEFCLVLLYNLQLRKWIQ